MAVPTGLSFMLSATLAVLLFAGMQIYKSQLASQKMTTILGGFLGHVFFILLLTAVSNMEVLMFGKGFQSKLVPEVVGCLVAAMFASGLVHRVCITTCLIFSLVAVYFINKISQSKYAPPVTVGATPAKLKKRN